MNRKIKKHLNRNKKKLLTAETLDKKHGRIEHRKVEIYSILPWQTEWPHTHTACRVTRKRKKIRRKKVVKESLEEVTYVGSFAVDRYSPEQILQLSRGHWRIENTLHHRKDRSMDEDRNRASEKKSGRIMCCLRSITALVFSRAKESLSVIQRRISGRPHLVLGLLSCKNLNEWEKRCKPYTLA